MKYSYLLVILLFLILIGFIVYLYVGNNMIFKNNYDNFCPPNYIAIPGGFDVDEDGINENTFCIMKYEVKMSENFTPVSKPNGKPWVNISQKQARLKCESLGEGYYLISNKDWIQVANLIVYNGKNWISSEVGNNSLFRGHSDKYPFETIEACNNDSNGYCNTGDNSGLEQKRTYFIENNIISSDKNLPDDYSAILWDFTGNIWEWNNDTIDCTGGYPCENMPKPAESRNLELPEIIDFGYFETFKLLRPNNYWNSSQNIGRFYSDSDFPIPNSSYHGLVRGGIYYDEYDAGPFTAYTGISPDFAKDTVGFRCIFRPNLN